MRETPNKLSKKSPEKKAKVPKRKVRLTEISRRPRVSFQSTNNSYNILYVKYMYNLLNSWYVWYCVSKTGTCEQKIKITIKRDVTMRQTDSKCYILVMLTGMALCLVSLTLTKRRFALTA